MISILALSQNITNINNRLIARFILLLLLLLLLSLFTIIYSIFFLLFFRHILAGTFFTKGEREWAKSSTQFKLQWLCLILYLSLSLSVSLMCDHIKYWIYKYIYIYMNNVPHSIRGAVREHTTKIHWDRDADTNFPQRQNGDCSECLHCTTKCGHIHLTSYWVDSQNLRIRLDECV